MNTPQRLLIYLQYYQKWRRGADIEQPNPTKLGEVLDEVIELLKAQAERPHRSPHVDSETS